MFAGRRSQFAVSGQQLAVSNGRPTSHEPLATIFPPLLPNRGGPLDRFRRGRPVSLFGPSGADQQEAQDGCQNGQRWLGVPLRESREMLFGENAIRRPQAAGRRSQSAGGPPDRFRRGRPVKASRYALRVSRSVVVSSWLVKPCLMDLLCISPFIRGGPPFGTAPTQAPVGAFLRAEGYSKRCCQFEVCRRAAASVGDVLKGVPLRAEGFPKRRCQFESVAAERRI